jgi:beta-hydroxylase
MEDMQRVTSGIGQTFKDRRRRWVKRTGKRFIHSMSDFLGRQSLVPDSAVLDPRRFVFTTMLERHAVEIRREAEEILRHRDIIPSFDQVSPDQKRISMDGKWRTFFLYGFGTKLQKNCGKAPLTASLLEQVPGLQTAWFSILAPGYHIPAHRGVTKGILTCHLGLLIPQEAERCRMRVQDQTLIWQQGTTLIFCDAYEHEVWNDTDEERTVLLLQFERPMRLAGRLFNRAFVAILKLTAYYKDPKRNMEGFEERFEAATRRANEALERMSEPADRAQAID